MEKNQRDLLIAVALVALFGASFLRNVVLKHGKKPAAGPAAASERSLTPEDLAAAVSSLALIRQNEKSLSAQEAIWEKDWGRDPFVPIGGNEVVTSTNLVLSGVVWDDAMPIAMINEKVLKIGDVIEGYRIAEIRPSSVIVVTPAGRSVEVQLFEAIPGQ